MEMIICLYVFAGLIVSGICLPVYYEEIYEEEDDDNWKSVILAAVLAFLIWPYIVVNDIILEKNFGSVNEV